MRPLFLAFPIALCALGAQAEPPAGLAPIPEPPAMAAELEPEVTIVRRGEDTVEEYRANGKLYMIKVTPPHGVPYYLVDREGNGVMARQDVAPSLSVPMWVIGRW